MTSHVPNKGERLVRYYGHYSNGYRGLGQKKNLDEMIASIPQPKSSTKECRKNWARLVRKIFEIDILTCPKCQGRMKIIGSIEDEEVIEKTLKHLGLWSVKT